jgi:hypothetical protein
MPETDEPSRSEPPAAPEAKARARTTAWSTEISPPKSEMPETEASAVDVARVPEVARALVWMAPVESASR